MLNKVLLIDFDNYLSRIYNVILSKNNIDIEELEKKDILNKTIESSIGFFDILNKQRSIYKDIKIIYDTKISKDNNIIKYNEVFWDTSDWYKWKRLKDNKKREIYNQLKKDYMNILYYMNYQLIGSNKYEADDIIGYFVYKLKDENNIKIDIYSWDKDLYQLLYENVSIISWFWYNKEYIDTSNMFNQLKKNLSLEEDIELDLEAFIYIKSFIWDKSDNIPWIKWVWPKKIGKELNKYKKIKETDIYTTNENIINKIYSLIKLDVDIDEKDLIITKNQEGNQKLLYLFLDKFYSKLGEDQKNKLISFIDF